jgi:hypothetical protein
LALLGIGVDQDDLGALGLAGIVAGNGCLALILHCLLIYGCYWAALAAMKQPEFPHFQRMTALHWSETSRHPAIEGTNVFVRLHHIETAFNQLTANAAAPVLPPTSHNK